MPILPELPRRMTPEVLRRAGWFLLWLFNTSAVASLLVAATAIVLWLLRVELQYVAGAFLIYSAQRLAQKRISPTTLQVPVPAPQPVRRRLDGPVPERGPNS